MRANPTYNLSFRWGMVVLLLLLTGGILLSLWVGDMGMAWKEMFAVWDTKEGLHYQVLINLKLPRIILAFSVGGALSLAGTLLQGIYRNPLVEPYTMGISGGAALGVAICIVAGLHLSIGALALPVFGFAGAVATIFLVYWLSISRRRGLNIHRMLLIGVMISFITASAMLFLMSVSTTGDLKSIIFWIMGSLNEPHSGLIYMSLITALIGLFISYLYVTPLNALRLGEVKAQHLGINTATTIRVLFIVSSLLTGISVSVAGVIGFVGLVIPHLTRKLVGSDYRILLPTSFLGGSVFLLYSDILAHTLIQPNELPIGVITGMIGGVVFIIALMKGQRR